MEIIETFEDTIDDMKKAIGDKGFLIIGIGVVVLFVVVLISQSNKGNGENVTVVSGVASYPDVVTNADVVISTLQNSIDYAQNEIQESIETARNENAELFKDMNEFISDKSQATNDYINEGFEKQKEIMDKHAETINENIASVDNNIHNMNITINNKIDEVQESVKASTLAQMLQTEQAEVNIRNDFGKGFIPTSSLQPHITVVDTHLMSLK